MGSTTWNIVSETPSLDPNGVCGKYIRYPDVGNRTAEGGMRLKGAYKKSTNNRPLVSIITVVYNKAEKLKRAIQSVINQTYDNIEYIIVDGNSNDGTLEVIKKHEEHIDYFISEPDYGIYNAMNKGLELATGDYIGILNSDDWFIDTAVEDSINAILQSRADYSGADEIIIDEAGNKIGNYGIYYFNDIAFFALNPCNHGTMFISKKVYNELGNYETSLKIAADLKYQLKIITHKYKHCILNKPIHYYELSGISFRDQNTSVDEVLKILEEIHPNLTKSDINAIARLRYYNEVNSATFQLLSKVAASNQYSITQKCFIARRISDILLPREYQPNDSFLINPEMLGIKGHLILIVKAVKRKITRLLD